MCVDSSRGSQRQEAAAGFGIRCQLAQDELNSHRTGMLFDCVLGNKTEREYCTKPRKGMEVWRNLLHSSYINI